MQRLQQRAERKTLHLQQPSRRSAFGSSTRRTCAGRRNTAAASQLKCLIFDCDGVILESEDLHRRAYNAAFEQFSIRCKDAPVHWDEAFYDVLQNTVGGGKAKMRWHFGEDGWPTSSLLPHVPESEQDQAALIDTLQDWKSQKYRDLIGGGAVAARRGVLRLMDEARASALKVAVCSAATKESVEFTLAALLGEERFRGLDCFLAGDDVPKKKPDPSIYRIAAERLGVAPEECLVIEDSQIGVDAAVGAGMRCLVTYTASTKSQAFGGAERIVEELGDDGPLAVTLADLLRKGELQDDRGTMAS